MTLLASTNPITSGEHPEERMTPEYFKTGVVVDVSPGLNTCTVQRTEGGFLYNVPVLNTLTGGPLSTDVSWASNIKGATVLMVHVMSQPYILATIPTPATQSSTVVSETTHSEDETASTYSSEEGYFSCRNIPQLPGDKVFTAEGGAKLLLGREGLVVLQASPLSQIVMGGLMDFVRIVCRELQLYTDFGEIEFVSGANGTTGVNITGGKDYSGESKPSGSQRSSFCNLGSSPNRSNANTSFGVVNKDGTHASITNFGDDGTSSTVATGNKYNVVGGNSDTNIKGNKTVQIDGDIRQITNGNAEIDIVKKHTIKVKDNQEVLVFGDKIDSILKNYTIHVQDNLNISAGSISFTSHDGSSGSDCKILCNSFNLVKTADVVEA